jgi:hypothetical protein
VIRHPPGIAAANREAFTHRVAADPVRVDCVPAAALGLPDRLVLHAGPSIAWTRMCPPLRGAIVGALRYGAWAGTDEDSERLAANGGVRFEPCHDHLAVGPMAGLVTRSMPVFVLENRTVETPVGFYFPGFGPDDANPDLGDSAIVETIGLGGMAMAASPAAARFVRAGGLDAALGVTADMREITLGEHPHFRIATDGDRGVPVGIDVRRVVETGITPVITTGIAGRRAGTGQVGAGAVRAPLGCLTAALEAFARCGGVA